MSYRSGFRDGNHQPRNSTQTNDTKGYSMNAVPPPNALKNSRGKFQPGRNVFSGASGQSSTPSSSTTEKNSTNNSSNLSKHGYLKMDTISQYSNLHSLGKRKAKTEDE